MFKTEEEAQEFAEKEMRFMDGLWTMEEEWTVDKLRELWSDDVALGWNGQWSTGIEQVLSGWKPVQNALHSHTNLSVDVQSFSDTTISFTEYTQIESWNKKRAFLVVNAVIDVNKEGKVCRLNMTAKKKYAERFNGFIAEYVQSLQQE